MTIFNVGIKITSFKTKNLFLSTEMITLTKIFSYKFFRMPISSLNFKVFVRLFL